MYKGELTMNNVKKIFAVMTAAASISVLSMAALTASAEETTVTTTATTTDGNSTETTTTAVSSDTSDSSTTDTTTTTAPSIKFNTNLIVYAGDKEEKGDTVLIEKNGDYTVSYKFASADELESLCLDASFNASEYENVKINVKSVEFGTDDNKSEVKLKKNEVAFDTTTIAGHSLIVIMSGAAPEDQQLGFEDGASITPEVDKSVYVTFTVSGLQETSDTSSTTTTTTARVYSYGNNNNNKARTNTTSTVAQTADFGVVAIVVTGLAAASAAACAMTARRKRK